MDWKSKLRELEKQKEWDEAIDFMQKVIQENPDDMDAWICMNYLLMNLLGEEDYDDSKFDYYQTLAKWYFSESYQKYSNNPEYLYITGKTSVMGPWHFGVDQSDQEAMIQKAKELDPENLVYKEDYYWKLARENPKDPDLIAYAHIVLDEKSPIGQQLKNKGTVGEYLLGMKRYWAKEVLED